MSEVTLWGIHAGQSVDVASLFRKKKLIAIGWSNLGNLKVLTSTRDAFKEAVAQAYPEYKPGAIPVNAGTLYKFVHEMSVGELVIYPSRIDRMVNIGRVEGEYRYDPSVDAVHPHIRTVKWLKSLPRTKFSQGALHEIGSAITLFQVRNFADEFLAALRDEAPASEVEEDETVRIVVEDIDQTTQDFILKTLSRELKGHPFEDFVAHLLNQMGYRTRVSPEGPDAGIDIIAHRDELGFEPPIIKVQVKSTEGSIGDPVVSALYGKVEQNEYGLLVTLGNFTNQAKNFARSKSNLRFIDGEELVKLILDHYDKFDARYKALLPLKRVYVPGTLSKQE
ncbi:MAG: restriction endonuclease [Proteobacteria bacterium]|nr:restriction endonuclease [Pseudomonadota bacterium]